ncbi:MAG: DNA topoisomerase [Myxococcota bacterium]
MGKRLVITEKPSVARDIVASLGGFSEHDGYWENEDFVVTFAVGHLFELMQPEEVDPKWKAWTLDALPINPKVIPLKPKKKTDERLKTLKKLLKRDDVEGLVNACDAGREGELIFREIADYFESRKPVERLWLQSMTKDAIRKGFAKLQPGSRYDGLKTAAYCRTYSDWLIGMNASRALTKRLKTRSEVGGWSAGRVQTPTLAMLVDRELEILSHVPKAFWRVKAQFLHGDDGYEGVWFDPSFKSDPSREEARDDRIFEEGKAKDVVAKVQGKAGLASETLKPSTELAPALFDLTSLQRTANSRFGWSARRTLNAAQRCYEGHKILTYPRTDSKALPSDYRSVVDDVIDQLASDDRFAKACSALKKDGLLNTKRVFDDSKVSDHFAIVPTGTLVTDLGGDDARLFDLVTRRFLATFFGPATWIRINRTTVVEGEHFRSSARFLQDAGWREVMGETEGEGKLVPLRPVTGRISDAESTDGVGVETESVELDADQTKPPNRLSEARLLSLMETAGRFVDDEEAAEAMKDSGIGTPATRAEIIENLISKGYVLRAGRGLKASVKGIRLIDILRRMRAERLASPALTGELEQHLAQVERGKMKGDAFMDEIYEYAEEIVDLTKNFEFEDLFPDRAPLGLCPCDKKRPVYERSWFYRCKEPEGLETNQRKRKKMAEAGIDLIEDCEFRVWKDKSNRYIDRKTVTELLEQGKSRPLDGFMTQQGRSYRGELVLHDKDVELNRLEGGDSEDASDVPEYEVDETPLGSCPVCNAGKVVETRQTFVCSRGLEVIRALGRDDTYAMTIGPRKIPEGMDYCGFLLPRTVCKREITRSEAETYLRDGKTPLLEEFTSRRGRPFSAILYLRDNGRHGFDFPPRPGRGAKGTEDADKPAQKKKTAKKQSTKKTSRKKAASKKASAKKAAAKKASSKKSAGPRKAAKKKKARTKKASKPRPVGSLAASEGS